MEKTLITIKNFNHMEETSKTIKPIVKQTGGKYKHLEILHANLPKTIKRYYEPFLGGGALAFSLQIKGAKLSDINKPLMNMYQQVKNDYEEVTRILDQMEESHSENYFLLIRDAYNRRIKNKNLNIQDGAYYIYLNKACFNGLYRLNKKGEFNVAWNKKDKINTYDFKNIRNMHEYLQNVEIDSYDFEDALSECTENDFVYIDCPGASNLKKKVPLEFDLHEHKRLINVIKQLDKDAVNVLITMSANDKVEPLYDELGFEKNYYDSRNSICCKGDKRNGTLVLFKNYK